MSVSFESGVGGLGKKKKNACVARRYVMEGGREGRRTYYTYRIVMLAGGTERPAEGGHRQAAFFF